MKKLIVSIAAITMLTCLTGCKSVNDNSGIANAKESKEFNTAYEQANKNLLSLGTHLTYVSNEIKNNSLEKYKLSELSEDIAVFTKSLNPIIENGNDQEQAILRNVLNSIDNMQNGISEKNVLDTLKAYQKLDKSMKELKQSQN